MNTEHKPLGLELIVSLKEIESQEYDVGKKLNSYRFPVDSRVKKYGYKLNGEQIAGALRRFLQVQAAVDEKLESLLKGEVSSSTGLSLATWIASQEGSSILNYEPSPAISFFENKQVNYNETCKILSSTLLQAYLQGMDQLDSSAPLEALTEAFFSWNAHTAAQFVQQSGYKEGTIKSIQVENHLYKMDLVSLEKKKGEKASFDITSYAVKPSTKGLNNGSVNHSTGSHNNNNHNQESVTIKAPVTSSVTTKEIEQKAFPEAYYLFGLDEVKTEFERVVQIVKYRDYLGTLFPSKDLFSNYLLVGPPGTGKTTLVNGLAQRCGLYFLRIPCVELGSHFFSKTASNIHEIYKSARREMQQEGYSGVIIFFDEIDHIAKRRGYGHSSEADSLVTTLNENLDGGSSTPGIITIGATNVEDMIDPAVLSKFKKLYVPLAANKEIVKGIHQTIIQKMEAYANKQMFAEVDYSQVLPFSAQHSFYKSGRTINRILHSAALEKAISGAAEQKFELVTTEDIVKAYHKAPLEENQSVSKYERNKGIVETA